ncbi:MAG: methyltransferase [Lysobacterales bacterium]
MENTSQLVLRNGARLPNGPLLLVNPPGDGLAGQLVATGRAVSVSTQDRGAYHWFCQGARIEASFDIVPSPAPDTRLALLWLPREKRRLEMLAHALSERLPRSAALWLVGENRAGIKSADKHLGSRFGQVVRLDNARHCGLYEATDPIPGPAFDLASYESQWTVSFQGREVRLASLPGVFAHGRLDRGTALLLEALETLRPEGKVLDFACGAGVIGLCLLARDPGLRMGFSDSSSLALESCRRSLDANGLEAEVMPSDGLTEVVGVFDWIVTNPPFHSGVWDNREVAHRFVREAGTVLVGRGRILVVYNRHLPYFHWLREHYSSVRTVVEDREYYVVEASGPIHTG